MINIMQKDDDSKNLEIGTLDQFGKVFCQVKAYRPDECTQPKTIVATQSYVDSLKKQLDDSAKKLIGKSEQGIMSLFGLPIHTSQALPKGVLCIVLNADNLPTSMIVDETYEGKKGKDDGK